MQKKALYPLLFISLMILSFKSFSVFDKNTASTEESSINHTLPNDAIKNSESSNNEQTDLINQRELEFIPTIPRNSHVGNLPHYSPIIINGNANFTTDGEWNGSGTFNDPYIFNQSVFINTNGGLAISITNTDAYFRIENLWVNGSTISGASGGAIHLKNVSNGIFKNNTFTNNVYGIQMESTNNNILTMNYFFNNSNGVHFFKYANNTFINNNIFHSNLQGVTLGGFLDTNFNNTISGNRLFNQTYSGIKIGYGGVNTILSNNTVFNNNEYGIYLNGVNSSVYNNSIYNNKLGGLRHDIGSNNSIFNNIIYNNTLYGIIIISSNNYNKIFDNILYNNTIYNTAEIYSLFATNHSFINNTIYNTQGYGIHLEYSNFTQVLNNSIYNKTGLGIVLVNSFNNIIRGNILNSTSLSIVFSNNNFILNNTISKSSISLSSSAFNLVKNNIVSDVLADGLRFYSSADNSIIHNIFSNSSLYAVYIDSLSNNNIIERNLFIDNNLGSVQAIDGGTSNIFQFNFWNDWVNPDIDGNSIVDQSYSIDGGANNQDNSPLGGIMPVIVLVNPVNNTVHQSGIPVTVFILDDSLQQVKYNWDGETNTSISLSNSSFSLVTFLPDQDQVHNLYIHVQNNTGSWHYRRVTFTTDDTPPTIIVNSPANGTTYQAGTVINLTISGGNGSLIYHWDTDPNTTVSDLFNPLLPIGDNVHRLYIYVKDVVGNWNSTYLEFTTDDPLLIDLNTPNNVSTQQSGTTIDLSILGSNGSLIYHWDSDSNSTVTDTYDPILPIGDGIHYLYIYVKDPLGNWNSSYFEFITDNIPPGIILNSPANGTTQLAGIAINLTINGGNGSIIYQWDNQANITTSDIESLILPAGDGLHQLQLYVSDEAGNWNITYLEFFTDDTPPSILLNVPSNNSILAAGTIIDVFVSGTDGFFIYRWDNGENITVSISYDPFLPSDLGLHQLFIYAQDNLGNWNSVYFEFTVEEETTTVLTETSSSSTSTFSSSTSLSSSVQLSSSQSLTSTSISPGFELLFLIFSLMSLFIIRTKSRSPPKV